MARISTALLSMVCARWLFFESSFERRIVTVDIFEEMHFATGLRSHRARARASSWKCDVDSLIPGGTKSRAGYSRKGA